MALFHLKHSVFHRLEILKRSAHTVTLLPNNIPYPERKIDLKIGRPQRDIDFQVSYIDTWDDRKAKQPIAFLIHGTPGSYHDYYEQISFLTDKGIRVIAPTYPVYKFVHETKRRYAHSPEDRANFTLDFLSSINVSTIDLLVSHSSSVYPALYLTSQPLLVNSLALLNPATLRHSKVLDPIWFTKILVNGAKYKPIHSLFSFILPSLLALSAPVKIKDIDHPIMANTTIISAGFSKVAEMVRTIKGKRTPTTLVYSLNDKLFEPKVYEYFLESFGFEKKDVWVYDDKGTLQKTGRSDAWMKIIELQNGTHYSLWKYPKLVNEALLRQINQVL